MVLTHCNADDAELPGQSNRSRTRPGHRRFRRLRPEEGAFKKVKNGLIISSGCEGPHSSPLQKRLFRPSIATHELIDGHWKWAAFVAGFAVLLFASGLALALAQLRVPAPPAHSSDRYTIFGVGHRIADFWQGLTLDGWAQRSSNSGKCQRPSWDFLRDRLLHHRQLESGASATHPENAIQPDPKEAHNTSTVRRNHETFAFQIRRCNHASQRTEDH